MSLKSAKCRRGSQVFSWCHMWTRLKMANLTRCDSSEVIFLSSLCVYYSLNSFLLLLFRYRCHTTLLVSIPAQASSTVCPSPCLTRCLILPSAHNPYLSPLSSQVSTFCYAVLSYSLSQLFTDEWMDRDDKRHIISVFPVHCIKSLAVKTDAAFLCLIVIEMSASFYLFEAPSKISPELVSTQIQSTWIYNCVMLSLILSLVSALLRQVKYALTNIELFSFFPGKPWQLYLSIPFIWDLWRMAVCLYSTSLIDIVDNLNRLLLIVEAYSSLFSSLVLYSSFIFLYSNFSAPIVIC